MGKAVDALQADGVTVEMLVAPKKDQDRAFYDSVCAAVVAGFTATVQDLLTKETKTLSDEKKGEKRYWQQQIGSKVKDLRNMLQRRLDSEDEDGAGSTSTLESRIKRDLTKYIAQLEKVEAFKGNVVELIKCLKSGLVYVK
jgi:DNA-binding protein Fis